MFVYVMSLYFAVARIMGAHSAVFKDFAHIWVGFAACLWYTRPKCLMCALNFWVLSVVEIISFLYYGKQG